MVVVRRKTVDNSSVLSHHGIKGQRWGEKNGPPYPLNFNAHSSAEKRQNPKSAIDGKAETGSKRKGLTDSQKELAKKIFAGAAVTAGVIAVGAISYKALESGSFDSIIASGSEFVSKNISNTVDKSQLGKSLSQIDSKMVKAINSDLIGTEEGGTNCFCTSIAYCNNSLFGHNEKALGITTTMIERNGKTVLSYVDPVSGSVIPGGPSVNLFSRLYNGLNVTEYDGKSVSDGLLELPKKSTGILRIDNGLAGHFINYECDDRGRVSVIDSQNNIIVTASQYARIAERQGYSLTHAIDFSNASINSDASFKELVK